MGKVRKKALFGYFFFKNPFVIFKSENMKSGET